MKKALITGITGQDGSYLAEFLLEKGYEVHGIKRRASLFNTDRIDHLYKDPHDPDAKFFLYYGDLSDSSNLIRLIQKIKPDEIYNLGAQSHVRVSFDTPEYTAQSDGIGPLRLLEAIRLLGLSEKIKFYQASSSELYGKVMEVPQKETTPFYPRSPYAVAKLYAYWITVNYREAYNIFACNGILFNHESPRRGETFVTRKITMAVARIKIGLQKRLYLGNIDAQRDWGYAGDYVVAMWKMLQQERAEDFVIATGITHSVRYFVEQAFKKIDIDLEWKGKGVNEVGINPENGYELIRIDPRYFRPSEVEMLVGDTTKAEKILNWKPKIDLDTMIDMMVVSDVKGAEKEKLLREKGYFTVQRGEAESGV